jgi:dinuclear metal center YbgI/SA1388 family protein
MLLNELTDILDKLFNKAIALPGDPVGLQVGKPENNVSTVLITLDINSSVINEAVSGSADLIIAHHPLIFNPVKNILGSDITGRMLLKLIENNIAVYIAHTNFDAMHKGLNDSIARIIGLKNILPLEKTGQKWYKFSVFVPPEAEDAVRNAVFKNGGGNYANYSSCSFNTKGTGTFMPLEESNPYTGKRGAVNFVDEIKIECVVEEKNLDKLTMSVIKAHPYEEPAYDIIKLENMPDTFGLACKGSVEPLQMLPDFMINLKKRLELECLRFACPQGIDIENFPVKRAAFINGSANSFTDRVSVGKLDCDIIIVGELKYNKVAEAVECGKVLIELGHGESEKFAIWLMYDILNSNLKDYKDLKIIKSKTGYTGWRYCID